MSSQKNELTTKQREMTMSARGGVVLQTLEDAHRFAKVVIMSGMAPPDCKKAETVLIKMQAGAELGMGPWQSIQSIAVINGRPTMWGDAVGALVQASGRMEDFQDWEEGAGEEYVCYVLVKRRGMASPITRSFGWKDAEAANLLKKDTYVSYLRRMCFNRARAFAFRDAFQDVLKGMHVREEVEDYPQSAVPGPRRLTRRPRPSELVEETEPEEPEPVDTESEPVREGEVMDSEGEIHEADEEPASGELFDTKPEQTAY